MQRRVIGVMTGTSLDGVDVAAVDVTGRGLALEAALVTHHASDLGVLAGRLRDAAGQVAMTAGAFAGLGLEFSTLIAERIAAVARQTGPPDLIAVHGQTIHHDPPASWQMLNPAPIAAALGCPVVFDLRQADLAAGGQGAPITPLADWILFRHATRRRAIVNLGGFCNVTVLASDLDDIRGFDVCACNQVLDAVARAGLDAPMDRDGAAAASGSVDGDARDALHAILDTQRTAERSLGTGDEAIAWVTAHADRLAGRDLAATAVHAVAMTIAPTLEGVDEIVIAGGGARNHALIATLRERCATPVVLSDTLGVPVCARESIAIAILGALCADGVPITLPQVTGCRAPAPVAGVWTAASDPS